MLEEKETVSVETKPEEAKGQSPKEDRRPRGDRPHGDRPRGDRKGGPRRPRAEEVKEFEEVVVEINRISKTVKGGRRMRFSALVVIGNKKGKYGFGTGKAA